MHACLSLVYCIICFETFGSIWESTNCGYISWCVSSFWATRLWLWLSGLPPAWLSGLATDWPIATRSGNGVPVTKFTYNMAVGSILYKCITYPICKHSPHDFLSHSLFTWTRHKLILSRQKNDPNRGMAWTFFSHNEDIGPLPENHGHWRLGHTSFAWERKDCVGNWMYADAITTGYAELK